jgi:hypothetical protein
MRRPCLGCGRLIERGNRCVVCAVTSPRNHRGVSRAARGYGTRHRLIRSTLADVVNAGRVRCARCGEPILVGQRWDLGHTDDRQGYTGPEHASCNRADGGRRSHAA